MKPRTKEQLKVVALSERLDPISEKQNNWAYEKCLGRYAVRSRNTLYCLECGHSWKDCSPLVTTLTGCTCPECKATLELRQQYTPAFTDSAYFAILDTIGGMQVVRMVYVAKKMSKKRQPYCYSSEVMQHWIAPSGDVLTLSQSVTNMSMYYDRWTLDGKLEPRMETPRSVLRHNIQPYKIYPERKVLPIIKRNGFKGHFYGIAPQRLFAMILRDNHAETLLKTNQISLLEYYSKYMHSREINTTYWPVIKICIRNGYNVPDATTWIDYIRLLSHFGKDLRNSKYVCPPNLKEAHDKLVRKKQDQERKKHREEILQRMELDQVEYEKTKGMFMDLRFEDCEIIVKPLETIEEFMLEGDKLKHCVFSSEYYKKPDSLVLSARIENKPIETIEVSLSRMEVIQARGVGNKATMHHDRILQIINSNMQQIANRASIYQSSI